MGDGRMVICHRKRRYEDDEDQVLVEIAMIEQGRMVMDFVSVGPKMRRIIGRRLP